MLKFQSSHKTRLKPYLGPPLKSWVRGEGQVNPLVFQLDAVVVSKQVVRGGFVSATRRKENQVGIVPAELVESVPDVSASTSLVPYDADADGIGPSDKGDLSADHKTVQNYLQSVSLVQLLAWMLVQRRIE